MAMTQAKDAVCLKFSQVSGATASTNITVSGIATEDTLWCVLQHGATAATVDRTSTTTITAADTIQCSTGTSGYELLVFWLDNSA